MKILKSVPTNGLAVFCGYNREDFYYQEVVPPRPIFTYFYRCSNELYLDPLVATSKNGDLIGIVAIDATECGVAIIDGSNLIPLKTLTSGVNGKSAKGGSSARRYERNREAELNRYYHRAAEYINDILLQYEVKQIVVAGPGFTKDEFMKKGYLDYRLKVNQVMDIEYSGLEGIHQTFNRMRNS